MHLVAVNAMALITLHMTAFCSFTLLTAVRGYHVYQDIWRPEIGDCKQLWTKTG